MSDKPKTKKECFAQLDEMLSDADKQGIMKTKDLIEFHFSLGMWIRNNWIYDCSPEDAENLYKAFGVDTVICQPDELSSEIIEAYQKYLRRKHK